MAQFLAELYLSRARPGDLSEVVRRACTVSGADGDTPVRYLRSIYIPRDETCLHLFDAVSAQELCTACRQAGIRVDRIVEATEVLAPEAELQPGSLDEANRHPSAKRSSTTTSTCPSGRGSSG